MMDGKYLYNQAFQVIDYCNNVSKNTNYNEYFSPNNIRRLIISPDAVMSRFYIPVPNVHSKQKIIHLPSNLLPQLESQEDYVPLVQIISTDRVCSSIEEIVFVTFSNDGTVRLGAKEYALESLIHNYNNRSGDLRETIKKRYVRLHDIIVFRGTFNQYKSIEDSNDKRRLISTWDVIKANSDIEMIHDEPGWYKKWGSPAAATTYPTMDGVDGHLYKYFTRYIAEMEQEEEAAGLEAFRRERYGAAEEEFREEFERFSKLHKMSNKLQRYIESYGLTANLSWTWKPYSPPEFYKCEILDTYPKQIDFEQGNDGDKYRRNKETAKKAIADIIYNLSDNCISMIQIFSNHAEISCKVAFKGSNYKLAVKQGQEALNVGILESQLSCSLVSTPSKNCAIDACWIIARLFLNKTADGFKDEIVKREYWKELLR